MTRTPDGEQQWTNLKIIQAALMLGPTLFLAVILIVSRTTEGREPDVSQLRIFQMLVGAFWLGSLVVKTQLLPLFEKKLAGDQPFQAYQTLSILRMSLTEGSALFGLVALIIHLPGADRSLYPQLSLFLLPYLNLIFTGLRTMPSKSDFEDRVRVARENCSLKRD